MNRKVETGNGSRSAVVRTILDFNMEHAAETRYSQFAWCRYLYYARPVSWRGTNTKTSVHDQAHAYLSMLGSPCPLVRTEC